MTRLLWSCLQVVFSQQVLGYPRRRELTLKCELFGLAGHYVLTLRSKLPTLVPVMNMEPAHIKVNWLAKLPVFSLLSALTDIDGSIEAEYHAALPPLSGGGERQVRL